MLGIFVGRKQEMCGCKHILTIIPHITLPKDKELESPSLLIIFTKKLRESGRHYQKYKKKIKKNFPDIICSNEWLVEIFFVIKFIFVISLKIHSLLFC